MGIKEKNVFDFAVRPGVVMQKYLKNLSLSQKELAEKSNLNKTIVNELIKGKRKFSLNIGLKLENVFGMPAEFWCNLQTKYDKFLIKSTGKLDFKYRYDYLEESDFMNKQVELIKIKFGSELLNLAV